MRDHRILTDEDHMLNVLKNGVLAFVAVTALSAGADAFGETVVCREKDSKTEYKLDFNWTKDTVDISARNGSGSYRKLYRAGTAVRNNAQSRSFLAEGIAAQYVGGFKGCGEVIETLYFEVEDPKGSSGILQKTGYFATKSSGCSIKAPAPDLSVNSVEVTCKKS
jgi:hypothetical protein